MMVKRPIDLPTRMTFSIAMDPTLFKLLPGNQLVLQMVMLVAVSSFVPFSFSPLPSSFVLPNTQDPQDVIEEP